MMILSNRQKHLFFLSGLAAVLTLLLACDAVNSITTKPVFLCATPSPIPTNTPFPTALPTYPWAFSATIDYYFYPLPAGQAFGRVNIQYMAQSTNGIQLQYTEYNQYGALLLSQSTLIIANTPVGVPGLTSTFPLYIFAQAFHTTIYLSDSVRGQTYIFDVYPSSVLLVPPNPSPCCLSAPIFPTAVPTYTPYPTATPFSLLNNFYRGDTVYTYASTSRIGIQLQNVTTVSPYPADPSDMAFEWTFQVSNIGPIEYDFYPYFQTYLSQIRFYDGSIVNSVWSASLGLGDQLGIPVSVIPVPLQPGQSQTFSFLSDGFQSGDLVQTIAFVLNPIDSSALSPTLVPGSDIIQFVNQPDPFCPAQIAPPTIMPLATP